MRAHRPRLRSLTFGLCLLAALLVIAPAVTQGKADKPSVREISLKPTKGQRGSCSVRYPWDGHLLRGLRLRESKLVRYLPQDAPRGRFFGTWQLVQLVQRAAQRVAHRYPTSRATFGELSGKQGGDIDGHSSHESGRDADVGFYITRSDGTPYVGPSFVEFDGNGRSRAPNPGLRFDVARNWELVSKLVDDEDARVQYIFVQHSLRELLLRQAVRRKASPTIIARANSVLVEPAHGNPHRNHFHVRIYCPPTDRPLCLDVAPYWPWYPGGAAAAVTNLVSKAPLSPILEANPPAP
jgi:penicillin-insensitive murein endopeptidase